MLQEITNLFQQIDQYKVVACIVQNICVQMSVNREPHFKTTQLLTLTCMYKLLVLCDEHDDAETLQTLLNQPKERPWNHHFQLLHKMMMNRDAPFTVMMRKQLHAELKRKTGGGRNEYVFALLALFPCVVTVTRAITAINNTQLHYTVERALTHHDVSAHRNEKGTCVLNGFMGGIFATPESVLYTLAVAKKQYNKNLNEICSRKVHLRDSRAEELEYGIKTSAFITTPPTEMLWEAGIESPEDYLGDASEFTWDNGLNLLDFRKPLSTKPPITTYEELRQELDKSDKWVQQTSPSNSDFLIHTLCWSVDTSPGESYKGHCLNLIVSTQNPDQGIIADPNGQYEMLLNGNKWNKLVTKKKLFESALMPTEGFQFTGIAESPTLKHAFDKYTKLINSLYDLDGKQVKYELDAYGPVFSSTDDPVHTTERMRFLIDDTVRAFEQGFQKLQAADQPTLLTMVGKNYFESYEATLQRFNEPAVQRISEVASVVQFFKPLIPLFMFITLVYGLRKRFKGGQTRRPNSAKDLKTRSPLQKRRALRPPPSSSTRRRASRKN